MRLSSQQLLGESLKARDQIAATFSVIRLPLYP